MDFTLEDCGSIMLLKPHNEPARQWLVESTPDEAMWWGGGLVIEPRYVGAIVNGVIDSGFTLDQA